MKYFALMIGGLRRREQDIGAAAFFSSVRCCGYLYVFCSTIFYLRRKKHHIFLRIGPFGRTNSFHVQIYGISFFVGCLFVYYYGCFVFRIYIIYKTFVLGSQQYKQNKQKIDATEYSLYFFFRMLISDDVESMEIALFKWIWWGFYLERDRKEKRITLVTMVKKMQIDIYIY